LKPYLEKNPSQKKTGGVAQSVDPEFKSQYHKKKKDVSKSWVNVGVADRSALR
jgi:hypothetical protein